MELLGGPRVPYSYSLLDLEFRGITPELPKVKFTHFKSYLEGLGIKYFHKIYKTNDTFYLIPSAEKIHTSIPRET